MKTRELLKKIMVYKANSAWKKGVKLYAIDIIEAIEREELPNNKWDMELILLNGAENWRQYSNGGCSLICDVDICERLCTESEKKRTNNGESNPNKHENWIDVQARALYQAFNLICKVAGFPY